MADELSLITFAQFVNRARKNVYAYETQRSIHNTRRRRISSKISPVESHCYETAGTGKCGRNKRITML